MKIPKIITTDFIAEKLGWSVLRARRWLQKTGAGEKRGGNWVTTLPRLQEHFPELYEILLSEQADNTSPEERPELCEDILMLSSMG